MQKKGTVSAYIVIVASIMLTKVLGLARNIFLTAFYGTGIEAGAFIAVSKLPLVLYDVTLGTAIVSAFIPVFNEKLSKANGDKQGANLFASNFLNIALVLSLMLATVGFCFPEATVKLFASGFSGQQLELAVTMMQIIMPVIVFATASFIFIGVLQSYGEFTVPALVSLFSNLSIILYFIFFNRYFGIIGLSIAFTIGWSLQLLFLLPFVFRRGFRYTLRFSPADADIKKVLLLTLPLFIASLAQPINNIISTNLSSGVEEGAGVAILGYAYDAYFIVAAVFASAMTNLFFPELSRRFAAKDIDGAAQIGQTMLKTVSAIILPVTGLMIALAQPLMRVLYQRGAFTAENTIAVALCLCIYCLGMLSLSWQEILNKFFYSMQNSLTPMLAALCGILLNLGLSFVLLRWMSFYGLALATLASGCVMAIFLMLAARRKVPTLVSRPLWKSLAKSFVAALFSAVSAYGIRRILEHLCPEGMLYDIILLIAALLVGGGIYLLMLYFTRSAELSALLSLLKKKEVTEDA